MGGSHRTHVRLPHLNLVTALLWGKNSSHLQMRKLRPSEVKLHPGVQLPKGAGDYGNRCQAGFLGGVASKLTSFLAPGALSMVLLCQEPWGQRGPSHHLPPSSGPLSAHL